MFLKSLTLRGFKSFADKTVLEFEPGVTVVVGPNGSGKSNLVDAVAWVLGAQGPRTLRGGKMDDVIFVGTPDRPALGRAEVSLTIDNTAGLLPIEFSEVTITRTLFRAGDSEYQINGAPCRLLDIQELLSDSGIGRQQHVIVGQGQLDTVLNSRPEDRRAIVEEAAGILKYRKRRERAERRLESTEGNLLRLNDLLREVRRQLTPLQRQADAARRHGGIVEELRAIRLHLVGHEIGGLQTRIERLRDARAEHRQRETELRERLRVLDVAVLDAEHTLGAMGDDALADALVLVESMRERARGLDALVAEKRRGVDRQLAAAADEGVVETLVADAGALHAELAATDATLAGLTAGPSDVAGAETELRAVDEQWRAAEADATRWRARADALELGLTEARAAAGAEHVADVDGVVGPLVDLLEIDDGAEAAVAAALGDAMRAVVVQGGDAAAAAVERLHGGDAHGLLLVVDALAAPAQPRLVPPGARPLIDFVHARVPGLEQALGHLLSGVVLVDAGWRTALEHALAHPDLVVLTPSGDRLGGRAPWRISAGNAAAVTQAAFEEAVARAAGAEIARVAAEGAVEQARVAVETARAQAVDRTALEQRRVMLAERLAAIETRLSSLDPDAQARAERARAALVAQARDYATIAERFTDYLARVGELHAPAARASARAVGGRARVGRAARRPPQGARCARTRPDRSPGAEPARRSRRRRDAPPARDRSRAAAHRVRRRAGGRARRARTNAARGHHARGQGARPRARAARHGTDQPARARGARRTAGAAPVPPGAARRRQGQPARAHACDPRRRP